MWSLRTRPLAASVLAATLHADGNAMSFAEVFSGWRGDADFADHWTGVLSALPFTAFCWETPPLTRASIAQPFECVFVDSPMLVRSDPDPAPFQEHFQRGRGCVAFPSLGQDAWLVAPCPDDPATDYAHLATFVRSASKQQAREVWSTVGDALDRHLGARPTWLSTAGLGVAWLHVRLDSRPKYYRHRPYAAPDFWTSARDGTP
jgi:hypothetical protein